MGNDTFHKDGSIPGENYIIEVNIELVAYINTELILNGCLGKKFNLKLSAPLMEATYY